MKQKRRFTMRVPVQRIQGIGMEIPDEVPTPTTVEQLDSVAVLMCPLCQAKRYVNQQFLDFLEEAKSVHPDIEEALARHKPCNVIMRVRMLEPEGA